MSEQYKIKIIASGKRKTSVARAILTESKEEKGKVTINKKDYHGLHMFNMLKIEEPLKIANKILGDLNFRVDIYVRGGGEKSRIDASRLALAKAIVKYTKSKELTKAYIEYDRNLLVADVRRKETRKPGDSKARAKRQTSYR